MSLEDSLCHEQVVAVLPYITRSRFQGLTQNGQLLPTSDYIFIVIISLGELLGYRL